MSPEVRVLFDALPPHLQEQALGVLPLRAFASPAGSVADGAARARFESEVRRLHALYVATVPGTVPESDKNRPSRLAQDRRGAGGAMPGHPRVSSTTGATVAAAVQEERRRLLAEVHELPKDLDAALGVAVDHARLARDAGASEEKVATLLGLYCRELWKRPAVRSEFADLRELDALASYRLAGGVKRRA